MLTGKLKKMMLFIQCIAPITAHQSLPDHEIIWTHKSETSTADPFKMAAWSLGIMGAYLIGHYAYTAITSHIEKIMVQAATESIILACTPNHLLKKSLSPENYDQALKKKARFIALRSKILSDLEKRLENADNFSKKHAQKLRGSLRAAHLFFSTIDSIRLLQRKNPYEKEYVLSIIDCYIAQWIVDSFIVSTKPDAECSLKELSDKKNKKIHTKKLITELARKEIKSFFIKNIEEFLINLNHNDSTSSCDG